MNWFRKVSQNSGTDLNQIMINVTIGDPQNQNQIWDGDRAVNQIQDLIRINGIDVVCSELMEILPAYAQYPVTRMIKNKCCGNYEMPQPEGQRLMSTQPILPSSEQEKSMDIPSIEID